MKFIAWHLGLGDAIICNGLVNFLSRSELVIIPCYEKNYANIKSFFINNENVTVRIVSGDTECEHLASTMLSVRLGSYVRHRTEDKGHMHFAELFYSDADVNYEERYNSCGLREASINIKQILTEQEAVFVSDRGSDGIHELKIDLSNKKIVRPYSDYLLLQHAYIITSAKEVHCIESAFLQLCEQLPTTGKLFYHKYARPGYNNPIHSNKNWETIN